MYLSVIIPAYNEEKNFKEGALYSVAKYLRKQKYTWEVLVVDDESTDGTLKLVKEFATRNKGFRVMEEPHRGKAGTVIAGMLAAKGDLIVFSDFDLATPITELSKLLQKFEEGCDVVIGSRSGRKGAPVWRKAMAVGFVVLRSLILRLPYKDTQVGFKGFKRGAAKKIFGKMKIFADKKVEGAAVTAGFDLEMLYIARKMGLTVAETPVEWSHKNTERVDVFKDSWQGLVGMLQVRWNAMRGLYK